MLAFWNKLTNPVKIIIAVVLFLVFCCCSMLIFGTLVNQRDAATEPTSDSVDVGELQTQAVQTVEADAQQETSPAEENPTDLPTKTPIPTLAPQPTATFTPAPDPIVLTGTGDSIVDFENSFSAAIVHITGNAGSRYFSVTSYDGNGNQLNLLVNATEPYDGIVPLDFRDSEHTTRFEIKAQGEWKVEVLPLTSARYITAPGTIEGVGDDVIFIAGEKPDLANIKGNADSRYFSVTGYGDSYDLLVNTTDPYEGTVILNKSTIILVIQANGAWSIEITSK